MTQDKLGIDRRFFFTPNHLPSGESPLTVILNARGRYQYYQFASRHVLARLKAQKESTTAAEPSLPSAPLPAPVIEPVILPAPEPVIIPDLRTQITPKKSDLRDKITARKTPSAPRKPWMKGRDLSYSGLELGGAEQDIREKKKKERG